MNVTRGKSSNPAQPATSPFPIADGWFLEWRGGDFCEPYGTGSWFGPVLYTKAIRFTLTRVKLPYIAYKFGTRGGYFGMKIYGVDSPTYVSFAGASEVFSGSQALMFSCRPFATIPNV